MKNADKPIVPLNGTDNVLLKSRDEEYIEQCSVLLGLTKREHFAGLAMQGYVASDVDPDSFENLAKFSVLAADALLAELDK